MPGQVSISPKRQAIAASNRTMFVWVAVMSAVVGVSVVVAIFLSQQIAFKAKVIGEISHTNTVLTNDNKSASALSQNIRVLETNAALNSIKANSSERALQVILDALPADRNTLALGASLQQSILAGVDGLTIDQLTIDGTTTSAALSTSTGNTIPIQLQVTAPDVNILKDMLNRMERSIRTIDIDNLVLEKGDTNYQMTISAHAYYEPAKTVTLTEKVIKP